MGKVRERIGGGGEGEGESPWMSQRRRCQDFKVQLRQGSGEQQNMTLFGILGKMRSEFPGQWRLLGHRVCRVCWQKATGVGRYRLARLLKGLADGMDQAPRDLRVGATTRQRVKPATETADRFLLWLYTFVAETLAEGDYHDHAQLRVNPPKDLDLPSAEQLYQEAIVVNTVGSEHVFEASSWRHGIVPLGVCAHARATHLRWSRTAPCRSPT